MDDLAAFLRARLDEDEAAAKAAGGDAWHGGSEGLYHEDVRNYPGPFGTGTYGMFLDNEDAHIIRYDPARVLREVAAKRAIIARYGEYPGTNIGEHLQWSQEQQGLGFALRTLAAIHSDHPDYDPDWAPSQPS